MHNKIKNTIFTTLALDLSIVCYRLTTEHYMEQEWNSTNFKFSKQIAMESGLHIANVFLHVGVQFPIYHWRVHTRISVPDLQLFEIIGSEFQAHGNILCTENHSASLYWIRKSFFLASCFIIKLRTRLIAISIDCLCLSK